MCPQSYIDADPRTTDGYKSKSLPLQSENHASRDSCRPKSEKPIDIQPETPQPRLSRRPSQTSPKDAHTAQQELVQKLTSKLQEEKALRERYQQALRSRASTNRSQSSNVSLTHAFANVFFDVKKVSRSLEQDCREYARKKEVNGINQCNIKAHLTLKSAGPTSSKKASPKIAQKDGISLGKSSKALANGLRQMLRQPKSKNKSRVAWGKLPNVSSSHVRLNASPESTDERSSGESDTSQSTEDSGSRIISKTPHDTRTESQGASDKVTHILLHETSDTPDYIPFIAREYDKDGSPSTKDDGFHSSVTLASDPEMAHAVMSNSYRRRIDPLDIKFEDEATAHPPSQVSEVGAVAYQL